MYDMILTSNVKKFYSLRFYVHKDSLNPCVEISLSNYLCLYMNINKLDFKNRNTIIYLYVMFEPRE